jgi:hypothetical protein
MKKNIPLVLCHITKTGYLQSIIIIDMNTSSIDLDTLFIKQIYVLSLIFYFAVLNKKNQINNKRRRICIFI